MQMSIIKVENSYILVFMRANIWEPELKLCGNLKVATPKTTTSQKAINQLFN
jgi:hypothetical protein